MEATRRLAGLVSGLSTTSIVTTCLALLIPYVLVCRSLRYYWIRRMEKHFGFQPHGNRPLSDMTPAEAFEIGKVTRMNEFLFTHDIGMNMSLITSYADPESANLLTKTDLGHMRTVMKRYADTGVIFMEFFDYPPGHPRHLAAVARMNFLHGQYKSKINTEATKYLACTIACLPMELIDRIEWRKTTEMEKHAQAVFWRVMLEEMGVEGDLPQTYDEMLKFKNEFEQNHFRPNKNSHDVVQITLDMATSYSIFKSLEKFWEDFLLMFVEDKVLESLCFKRPKKMSWFFFNIFFPLRNVYLRNFALPSFKAPRLVTHEPNENGRYYTEPHTYTLDPWYVKPNWWFKVTPWNIVCWLKGWPLPTAKGYGNEGYKVELLGPEKFVGKGLDQFKKETEYLNEKFGGLLEKKGRLPFLED